MDISSLEVGQIIKNYKVLCEILEITPSAGNTKKAQFKELERYINYEKQGQKFIVKEIYNEIKEKVDMRSVIKEDDKRHDGNNNIYGEDIKVRAKIYTINGLSAHADRKDILSWMSTMQGLHHIYLIHGEVDKMEIFKPYIKERLEAKVHIVKPKEAIYI